MTHVIPLGTSEPQVFQLLNNGQPINGTGLTPTLEIKKLTPAGLSAVTGTLPTVAWQTQSSGIVTVTGTEHLGLGLYQVRYKLTDAGNKVGFAPNVEDGDVWKVVKV